MVNYKKVALACWLFFGICIFYATVISSFVEGKQVIPEKYRGLEHKGTIKTIVSPDDVIDCVDFYKQPAFDDPQIRKDFKLKMESNVFVDESTEMTNDEFRKHQTWLKYGECPDGTIPIRRTLNRETHMKKRLPNRGSSGKYARASHEYAIFHRESENFGVRAILNVWNPEVEKDDFSTTQIWVLDTHDEQESIETGWIVYPKKYNDSRTRFFILWSSGNYKAGCWDLDCTGFIQLTKSVLIGGLIAHTSTYKGESWVMDVAIYKDEKDGDWWLRAMGIKVGYWPKSLFKNLKYAGESVEWGGYVFSPPRPGNDHTTTDMGSGHITFEAFEGSGRVSYVYNMATQLVRNDKLIWENASATSDYQSIVTRLACYSLTSVLDNKGSRGPYFYYGGPGASAQCK